jgi:serine/threonine protein kinase
VDVFSTAVILFIIVNGIFPFKEATSSDIYYQLITQGQLEAYWNKVGVSKVSWEFKDLVIKMLSPHGRERPTFEQIREHPWM